MQAIMETLFDLAYLISVISMGAVMIKRSKGVKQDRLFGIMAVILGCGDAFHLVPRAYALWTTGLEANAAALGIGKLITSITMTVFYIILYHIWCERYHIKDYKSMKAVTGGIYFLAILRVLICLFPQNQWLQSSQPLSWSIYRNLPFLVIGIFMVYACWRKAKDAGDKPFRFLGLAIALSFIFYIPVVLFADTYPLVGMLMIPKTLMYLWIVIMGFMDMKNRQGNK